MQNRNILWFTLGTLILLGAQWFVTSRYAPVAPSINNPAPTITRTEPITPPTPMAVAKPTRGLSPGYTVTISNPDIDVSFRKDTGALVQVKWLRDGTLFSPTKPLQVPRALSAWANPQGSSRIIALKSRLQAPP